VCMVWTQHASDEGVPYWYDAATGVSTWDKPVGFKPSPSRRNVQHNPKAKSTRFNKPARPSVFKPKPAPARGHAVRSTQVAKTAKPPKTNLRRSSITAYNPPDSKLAWAGLVTTVLIFGGLCAVLATKLWQEAKVGDSSLQADIHVGLLDIEACVSGTCSSASPTGDYKETGEVAMVWGISASIVLGTNLIVTPMLLLPSKSCASPQGLTDMGLVCAFLGTVLLNIAWIYYLKHYKEDENVQLLDMQVGNASQMTDHKLGISFIFAVVIGLLCLPYTYLFYKLRDSCMGD